MTAPAYSSSASAAGSGTVAKPANTGGILVLIGGVYDDATVSIGEASPPTVVGSEPWTLQGFATQGTTDEFTASWIWTKPAEDGTDPANFTWSETTSGTYLESIILRYTHADGVPSVNAVGTSIAVRAASGNIPAVTTTVDECTIVAARIGYDNPSSGTPATYTERIFMDSVNYVWDRSATPAGTFGPTSDSFTGTDGSNQHAIALGPPSGGAAGGTIDPTALVPIFRTIRWLPVWTGSPGVDVPAGDLTVDASVEVGITAESEPSITVTADSNAELGVVARSTVTPEPSALTTVEVGITSRSTVTPEPAAAGNVEVGVVPVSVPSTAADLTVTSGVFVGVATRATVTPQPSAITAAVVGVVARTTYTPEPSAASRSLVGVTARADASITVTTTTAVLVGVVPRSDLTPANDVTVTAGVFVGVISRTTYSPNITPTATAAVGVISRATPTITVQGTGRVLVGVAPTSQPTITVTYTSKLFVGVVLSNTLVPLGAILVDRIDVYIEPGPATYQEPSPIVWVEPTRAGYEEPVPDGWREPTPAQGAST